MVNELKKVFSVEDIILKDNDLIQIKGGTAAPVNCGAGCGVGCGNSCGSGCSGCTAYKKVASTQSV